MDIEVLTTLVGTCDNLSAVLNEMCRDTSRKEQLLKVVRELSENDVEDIEFEVSMSIKRRRKK